MKISSGLCEVLNFLGQLEHWQPTLGISNNSSIYPKLRCLVSHCLYEITTSISAIGTRCEIATNPCQRNPCLNGGTCSVATTTASGYTCSCPTQFTGTNCQTRARSEWL